MSGWMSGWMNGWIDGQTDEWMDRLFRFDFVSINQNYIQIQSLCVI